MKPEDKIRQAIQSAQQQGVTICTSVWGVDYDYRTKKWVPKKEKTCCALGTVMLKYVKGQIPDAMSLEEVVSNVLGVNEDWIDNFIRGFDNYNLDPNNEACKIGQQIRMEYNARTYMSAMQSDEAK